MPAFNARLLERCLALGDKDHYRKGGRETDLFAEDRKALLALPETRFDVAAWKRMKADKYGIVTVEGRHRYAAGPEHAGREPVVGLRAFEVRAARCLRGPHHDASARLRRQPHQQQAARPADRAAVATGPGPGPTARSERRLPTRCANGSTGRRARSSPRGCARPARAERESGWANAVAAMAEIHRDHRRHRPRRRMPGRGPTRRRDRARRLRRARRSDRIRPGVRREGGQRMNQRNEERTDIDRLRARARALFISQATIDDLLAWATPRQLQAVDRLLHTELDNRETSKRARLLRRARFPVPKTLDGHGLHEREAARRVRPGRAALPGLRRQGPGPRVLREDRTRQDPPGHRAGHERDRPGHERTLPAHRRARPSAGPRQARGNPRDHAQGHRQSRSDHPGTGSATCPSTSTAPDCSTRSSPAATREGASSSATNIESTRMGHDLRRRQTRRLDHRPHRSPRTTHRVHRTKPPHQPGTHVRQTPKPIKHTRPAHPRPKPKKIPDENRNTNLTKNTDFGARLDALERDVNALREAVGI